MNDPSQNMWPKVAVVIVNWNGERFLDRCLSALLAQTVAPHEIILVDNASSDASLDIVQRFPSVRLLAQNENLGFSWLWAARIKNTHRSRQRSLTNRPLP